MWFCFPRNVSDENEILHHSMLSSVSCLTVLGFGVNILTLVMLVVLGIINRRRKQWRRFSVWVRLNFDLVVQNPERAAFFLCSESDILNSQFDIQVVRWIKEICGAITDIIFGILINIMRMKVASHRNRIWRLMTFKTIDPVMQHGVNKQLDFEDLLQLPIDMDPSSCHALLLRMWDAQKGNNLRRFLIQDDMLSIWMAIFLHRFVKGSRSVDGYVLAISLGLVSVLKIRKTAELLSYIRTLKMYGWELLFASWLTKTRSSEVQYLSVPWIMSGTIRDNILLGKDYDQKRALYHGSDTYLLDDVLSAVDAHVARSILQNAFLYRIFVHIIFRLALPWKLLKMSGHLNEQKMRAPDGRSQGRSF
ncbi:UNVERIFIED_CONTAM: ABC transporter C family member 13 [Sesamum radiatum]|uniref:ABC transporter C family member 13 n=1 Tax=Sesamum radiatum TaxID=300843 RepID=A0AAW2WN64_SESRA